MFCSGVLMIARVRQGLCCRWTKRPLGPLNLVSELWISSALVTASKS
jgi:hypothetical protein